MIWTTHTSERAECLISFVKIGQRSNYKNGVGPVAPILLNKACNWEGGGCCVELTPDLIQIFGTPLTSHIIKISLYPACLPVTCI